MALRRTSNIFLPAFGFNGSLSLASASSTSSGGSSSSGPAAESIADSRRDLAYNSMHEFQSAGIERRGALGISRALGGRGNLQGPGTGGDDRGTRPGNHPVARRG